MPTRRPLARTRATAQALPPRATPWIVNSRSITFIATWRGQLLVCTVAVVLGAIYFVLREPIGRWRRRQRERLSRLRGEELLSMDKGKQHPVTVLEDRAAGPSSRSASAVASVHSTTARERGREKRKEKKRERSGQTDPTSLATTSTTTSGPSGSSIDSSPSTHPTVIPKGAALEPSGLELDLNPVDAAPVGPRIISLESSASESPAEDSPLSASQLETLQARVSSVPTLCIDIGEDGFGSEATDSLSVSHSRSTSYSIIPEDLPLELTRSAGRKKKRRSKARSGSGPSLGIGPSLSMSRNTMVSSDETHSHSSPAMSAPSTPLSPRRRRELSLGGLPLTPALELLIGNNERTIDSLRAEIGHAKAEESKAREDETRARDDLRRARGAEDRMRHDYERARKARDRAEVDSRRLEAEVRCKTVPFLTLAPPYPQPLRRSRSHVPCRVLTVARARDEFRAPVSAPPCPTFPASGFPWHGLPVTCAIVCRLLSLPRPINVPLSTPAARVCQLCHVGSTPPPFGGFRRPRCVGRSTHTWARGSRDGIDITSVVALPL